MTMKSHQEQKHAANRKWYPPYDPTWKSNAVVSYLTSPKVAADVVRRSGIKPTDVVLEIQPGNGDVTEKLLQVAKYVVAFELNPDVVRRLNKRFHGYLHRLKIIQGDFRNFKLPYYDVCVANIPYKLFTRFAIQLDKQPALRFALIILHHEFARRLVANPGDDFYCRLSVHFQLIACIDTLIEVDGINFYPYMVDSFVVRYEPRRPFELPVSLKEINVLAKICFKQKKKTLASIFRQKKGLSTLEKYYKRSQEVVQKRGESNDIESENCEEFLADMLGELSMEDNDSGEEMTNTEDRDIVGEEQSDFKKMVLGLLKQGNFADKKVVMLTKEDFVNLISLFNKAGIRFK